MWQKKRTVPTNWAFLVYLKHFKVKTCKTFKIEVLSSILKGCSTTLKKEELWNSPWKEIGMCASSTKWHQILETFFPPFEITGSKVRFWLKCIQVVPVHTPRKIPKTPKTHTQILNRLFERILITTVLTFYKIIIYSIYDKQH